MMAQREILFLLLDQMIIVTSDKLALCTQCVILIAVLSMENIGAYV